jgi:hypothetical protein
MSPCELHLVQNWYVPYTSSSDGDYNNSLALPSMGRQLREVGASPASQQADSDS